MSLDAMKQALAALEECIGYKTSPFMTRECEVAITALRAAIEQAHDWDEVEALRASLREHMAEIQRLRAAIKQAQEPETELETYKRLYELRGKALERPCSNCGHQPAKIKAMAQPEQEPVAWMNPSWIDPDTRGWANDSFESIPIEGWIPLYTAPRQWQGLTDEEIRQVCWESGVDGATGDREDAVRAAIAKLKEKNT